MGSATVQGQLWGTGPDDWAEVIEPLLRPVHLAALAALAPLSGLSLLDAGCGAGLALRLAAERGAVHARYRQPDGSYRQENVFRYVIACKPG
jgi:2-polyprenyl-3-methyl-5-hydroxy-6-metoxy-1,4-benzoquinol methylase